jgi:hypothetical protein
MFFLLTVFLPISIPFWLFFENLFTRRNPDPDAKLRRGHVGRKLEGQNDLRKAVKNSPEVVEIHHLG